MAQGLTLVAAALAAVLTLAGCSSPEQPDPGPPRIELDLRGDQAPAVERVEVPTGEEVEIVVTADEPGELHVHSQSEQVLEYDAGTTELTLTIDQPGVVDVERHEPEALVLQLEVG